MLVSMSDKELKRLSVLQEICDQRITQSQAAQLLHISERQIRRLLQKYKAQGPVALAHAGRGQTSNSRLPEEIRLKCLNLVAEQFHGFGPTLAHEKLTTVHGFDLSVETLRSWMIAADLWIPRSKRLKRPYQPRYNRDCFGELIQIDGSHHDWFEGRREKCCLIVFIDDATNLVYCRIEESETTLGYMRATKDYVETYGKPVCFYSDKHTIFKSPDSALKPNETQFQRACTELGITTICANTPQAKGRVERVNGTLQDRLVKELRLNNIYTNIDGATPKETKSANESNSLPIGEDWLSNRAANPSKKSSTAAIKIRPPDSSKSPLKLNTIPRHPQSRLPQVIKLGMVKRRITVVRQVAVYDQ